MTELYWVEMMGVLKDGNLVAWMVWHLEFVMVHLAFQLVGLSVDKMAVRTVVLKDIQREKHLAEKKGC